MSLPQSKFKNLAESWAETDLVGIGLEVVPVYTCVLYPQYTIALHAWFLKQVQQFSPALSAELHDNQTEKAFTLSSLMGPMMSTEQGWQVSGQQTYEWVITALSRPVVDFLGQWLPKLPEHFRIKHHPFKIKAWGIVYPALSYAQLNQPPTRTLASRKVTLSFMSPTSFRRKGHHLPLPWPTNVFHSYLRRWNTFSGEVMDQDRFLDWVDDSVIILRHQLESTKILAGKQGAVTGFTGSVEFGIAGPGRDHPQWTTLLHTLSQLAPYFGTGHKTTFGLGQTRLGWYLNQHPKTITTETSLSLRIAELTDYFLGQRCRQGGERSLNAATTWATILARRETGESLQTIADDLQMNYATIKTYAKLARKSLQALNNN